MQWTVQCLIDTLVTFDIVFPTNIIYGFTQYNFLGNIGLFFNCKNAYIYYPIDKDTFLHGSIEKGTFDLLCRYINEPLCCIKINASICMHVFLYLNPMFYYNTMLYWNPMFHCNPILYSYPVLPGMTVIIHIVFLNRHLFRFPTCPLRSLIP